MNSSERLDAIFNLVSDYLASDKDLFLSTHKLLDKVCKLTQEEEMEETPLMAAELKENIVISCDASITVNPGGTASAAYIISFPDKKKVVGGRLTPAKTINEAEYDAIYEGLVRLSIEGKILYPVVVYSDSKLVVNQLMGKYKNNTDTLKNKCASIHELAARIGIPVEIRWAPRNSTPDLRDANFHAQDLVGVPRH